MHGNVQELPAALQFLVSCGPRPDLALAQAALAQLTTPALLEEQQLAASTSLTHRPVDLDQIIEVPAIDMHRIVARRW